MTYYKKLGLMLETINKFNWLLETKLKQEVALLNAAYKLGMPSKERKQRISDIHTIIKLELDRYHASKSKTKFGQLKENALKS